MASPILFTDNDASGSSTISNEVENSDDQLPPFLSLTETDEPTSSATESNFKSRRSRKRKRYASKIAEERRKQFEFVAVTIVLRNLHSSYGFYFTGDQFNLIVNKYEEYPSKLRDGDQVVQIEQFSNLNLYQANRLLLESSEPLTMIIKREVSDSNVNKDELYTNTEEFRDSVLPYFNQPSKTSPSLTEAMHGRLKTDVSKQNLIWQLHEANEQLKVSKGKVKMMAIENARLTDKLNIIQKNYDQLTTLLKSVDPAKVPSFKYQYDPRLYENTYSK